MSNTGARKIGSLIRPLALREIGMPPDVVQLPEILDAWRQAVGAELAAQVQPIRLRNGKLILRAASPAWVSRVRHAHESLVRLLRREPLFRDLVDVEVRAAPREFQRQKRGATKPPPLSESSRHLLESVAADIDDPALRAALTRLAGKVKS